MDGIYYIFFVLINVQLVKLEGSTTLLTQAAVNVHEGNFGTSTDDIIFHVNKTVKISEGSSRVISWTTNVNDVATVEVLLHDNEFTATIVNHEKFFVSDESLPGANEYFPISANLSNDVTVYGFINVTAKFVGFNAIDVTLINSMNEPIAKGSLPIAITLKHVGITNAYRICLTVVLISVYTTMGANLDLKLVKNMIKKPIGPMIGLFCQYICMPLIAFGLGFVVFPDNPLLRLGLFASGSSPGGGLSNMWTHLLGGSLDLSIMMTFTSTVVALGAVPFWLLTVGPLIVKDAHFQIPYLNVFAGVFILIVPCFIGILIQLKLPKVTKFLQWVVTPLSILNIMFIFTFGVYANFYLFSYITWHAVVGGFGQSILGHLAGILFGVIFKRSKEEVIAISIETAVQNNGIAFLLLKLSLDSPAADIAVLMPGCVTLFMPLPLIIACLIRFLYLKRQQKMQDAVHTIEVQSADKSEVVSAINGVHNPGFKEEEFELETTPNHEEEERH